MSRLLSCPFCRELFSSDEGPRCPGCDLPLVDLNELPPSLEAQAEAALLGELDPPEDQRQSWLYWGRGRGPLIVLAALGLAAFFAPWISIEHPESITFSGFDLARSRAPWLWGGAIGWFLLIPLVVSRRSVNELRGVRVIATTFALMTLGETALLHFRPPEEHSYFRHELSTAWALAASAVLSALAALVAARLGGSLTDLRDLDGATSATARSGEPLH